MDIDNKVLTQFLKDVYSRENNTVLTSVQIKEIEDFYKKNYKTTDNFNEFLFLNPSIAKNIKKIKGVNAEVERQFKSKKLLQEGTLCECVLAQTIAKIYNLNDFADLFHTYIRELPANIIYSLRDDENKILCRYLYYNKDNPNTFLIQYGNPTKYDADLYINNQIVKLEFKDKFARIGEKETEYNEEGKLIYTEEFATKNPVYLPIINKFNKEKNLIDLSTNYPLYDEEIRKSIFKAYFKNLGFDVLVSLDDSNQLIAITEDCIDLPEEKKMISLDGSEIRRAGKNDYTVFTPKLLQKSITDIKGIIKDDTVSIPIANMENRIYKGKLTGKKINHLFFVTLEKIENKDDKYIFSLNDVRQLKPTLSAHMHIIASRKELIEYYKKSGFATCTRCSASARINET